MATPANYAKYPCGPDLFAVKPMRLSSTDIHVARALDNHPKTSDAECAVIDEIINAWSEHREPEAGTLPKLYAICRRLGINVY